MHIKVSKPSSDNKDRKKFRFRFFFGEHVTRKNGNRYRAFGLCKTRWSPNILGWVDYERSCGGK